VGHRVDPVGIKIDVFDVGAVGISHRVLFAVRVIGIIRGTVGGSGGFKTVAVIERVRGGTGIRGDPGAVAVVIVSVIDGLSPLDGLGQPVKIIMAVFSNIDDAADLGLGDPDDVVVGVVVGMDEGGLQIRGSG